MGICESQGNSSSISNDNNKNNQISFRSYYDIKNIYEEIKIINVKENKYIKSKIKILNGNKKEKIINTKKFNKIGINTIDFIMEGKLTKMNNIFDGYKSLIKIEFISIDTSKVNDMNLMFCGCDNIEYLDLSSFDTSNVESMSAMFEECSKLKEIKGINNFKINKNCKIEGIFDDCDELDYLTISKNKKISIDVHKLISKDETKEKIISIMFFIPEQNIHYPIPCNEFDSFSKIENKLF